jgi:hypothetical protein
MLTQAVRQVLQEMGVEPGKGEGEAKPKKKGTAARLDEIEQALQQAGLMGGTQPEEAGEEKVPSGPDGMSAGSGAPAGEDLPAMPGGPLDPTAGPLLGEIGGLAGSHDVMPGMRSARPMVGAKQGGVSGAKVQSLIQRLRGGGREDTNAVGGDAAST